MPGATYFVQECPTCGRRLQIRLEYLGKRVVCQHCQGTFAAADASAHGASRSTTAAFSCAVPTNCWRRLPSGNRPAGRETSRTVQSTGQAAHHPHLKRFAAARRCWCGSAGGIVSLAADAVAARKSTVGPPGPSWLVCRGPLHAGKPAPPVLLFAALSRPFPPLGLALQPVVSTLQSIVSRNPSIARNVQRPRAISIRARATCARSRATRVRAQASCLRVEAKCPRLWAFCPRAFESCPRSNGFCLRQVRTRQQGGPYNWTSRDSPLSRSCPALPRFRAGGILLRMCRPLPAGPRTSPSVVPS